MAVSESTLATAPGGGVFAGQGWLFNAIALLLVQIVLVILVCRLLGVVLRRYCWQPNVIAEVIGGIVLGPTILGQIPKFSETIFPPSSLGGFKLVAEVGLILFLFIVGMELDPGLLRQNVRRSFGISATGIVVPFAISLGVSHLMYQKLPGIKENGAYGPFALFIGVSNSVTAFPVLSRILTENKLLRTVAGVAAISAAAFDDVAVWCLLALTIAVVNASSPLQALWVFLSLVIFASIMLTAGKHVLYKLCTKLSRDWSQITDSVSFVCLALALISSYAVVVLGVDAIFGAFIAGLMVPRQHNLAVHLTEKIEDLTTVILLPLYFATSGLKTDLTTLDSGRQWGYVVLVILVACAGKLFGCGAAAYLSGLSKRESTAIAILMNCRGLVELIILNIGLDAGVITVEVFGILVIMALVTTFMTSPLVRWVYPPQYHYDPALGRPSEQVNVPQECAPAAGYRSKQDLEAALAGLRVLMCIPGRDSVTSIIKVVHMLNEGHGRPLGAARAVINTSTAAGVPNLAGHKPQGSQGRLSQMSMHAVRMIPLPDGRFSSDMRAVDSIHTLRGDEVVDLLRAYSRLHRIVLRTHLAMAPEYYAGGAQQPGQGLLSRDLTDLLKQHNLNAIVVPWDEQRVPPSSTGGMPRRDTSFDLNGVPLAEPYGQQEAEESKQQLPEASSPEHTKVVQDLLLAAQCRVAVLVDRGFNAMGSSLDRRRILVPYFGGSDDEEAIVMAIALSRDPTTEAHILWVRVTTGGKTPVPAFPAAFPDGTTTPAPQHGRKPSALQNLVDTINQEAPLGDTAELPATKTQKGAAVGQGDSEGIRLALVESGSPASRAGRDEAFLKLVESLGLATISETFVSSASSDSLFTPVRHEIQQCASGRYAYSLVVLGHAGGRVLRAGTFGSGRNYTEPHKRSAGAPTATAAIPLKHQSLHASRGSGDSSSSAQYFDQHTWGRMISGSHGAPMAPKQDHTLTSIVGEMGRLIVRSVPDISLLVVHKSQGRSLSAPGGGVGDKNELHRKLIGDSVV